MAEKYYKVAESDLVAIADRTRAMAGITESLSIAEIIHWLGRVTYIPQSHANMEFAVPTFDANTTGALPVVVKAFATSDFAIDFEKSS